MLQPVFKSEIKSGLFKFNPKLSLATLSPKFAVASSLTLINQKGISKSELKVPYTDADKATDKLLYSSNKNAKQKQYIPEYKIGVHRISGSQQFKIQLVEAKEGEGGFLKIEAESSIPNHLKSKKEIIAMKHHVSFALRYTIPGNGLNKRFPFTEIQKTQIGHTAILRINSFNEFNQVFSAISDGDYKCKLEINRQASVAIPKFKNNKIATANLKPILNYTNTKVSTVRGQKFRRFHLSVSNWNSFSNSLFRPSPELPPCGLNKKASRTWVNIYDNNGKKLYGYCAFTKNSNLQNFSFALPIKRQLPKGCYIELNDRKTKKKYRSNIVSLTKPSGTKVKPGEKLYQVSAHKFLQTHEFHFPESRHPYIYRASGTDRSNSLGGFKPITIEWDLNGSSHIYLQEEIDPKTIYFLPDNYEIAQEDTLSLLPKMQVELSGERLENLEAQISYEAHAVVETSRLEDALLKLKNNAEITDKDISLKPLLVNSEQLKFTLNLPDGKGFTERKESLVTLETIKDDLPPIALEIFEEVFDSLTKTSGISNLLTGQVEVNLPGIQIPPIPVALSFTNAEASMLSVDVDNSSNFQLEIKNNSPKTLTAQGVIITIQDGENIFTGSKAGLELPLELVPGASKKFTVIPHSNIENMEQAMIGLTWEGIQQKNTDGSLGSTLGTFSISDQKTIEGKTITLNNQTQSTIYFDGIQGTVNTSNAKVPLVIKNLSLPATIPSGDSISFDATPSATIKNYKATDIEFSWQNLKSEPNKELLFDAIVDSSINADYESDLKVSLFIDPLTVESTTRLLKVEFKNSEDDGPLIGKVFFDASDQPNPISGNIEKTIALPLSVRDYVLGATTAGQYWYKITLIKKTDGSGASISTESIEGNWHAKSGSLEITTELLPKANTL